MLYNIFNINCYEDDNLTLPHTFQPINTNRFLSKSGEPDSMTQSISRGIIVGNGRVRSDAVIPQRHSPIIPLDTDLEILREGDVLFSLVFTQEQKYVGLP